MRAVLEKLPVIFLDCQTTAASPNSGHLLEVAWMRADGIEDISECSISIHSFVLSLPRGEEIPGRIAGMTGITDEMVREGIDPEELVRLLEPALKGRLPVAHYAAFEARWLNDLLNRNSSGKGAELSMVCTREIARRLYPSIPRKGIRAVSGYLGHSMAEKKRSWEHVRATALIWRDQVQQLKSRGVNTLGKLRDFLRETPPASQGSYIYPISRKKRLSISHEPGVYHLLARDGKVLYVGKATSMKSRVNSYFTRRSGSEKTLELVSQVHDVRTEECSTPLEAALLEIRRIKELDPPYNVAFRKKEGKVLFISRDLRQFSPKPVGNGWFGPVHPLSPALLLARIMDRLNGSAIMDPGTLGLDYAPLEEGALERGFEMVSREVFQGGPVTRPALLRTGRRIWMERKSDSEDKDEGEEVSKEEPLITGETVSAHLGYILARGVRDLMRGAWLRVLAWSSITWEAEGKGRRFLVLRRGLPAGSRWNPDPREVQSGVETAPVFSVMGRETFDRLRVLDSEVRRIVRNETIESLLTPAGKRLDRDKMVELYSLL